MNTRPAAAAHAQAAAVQAYAAQRLAEAAEAHPSDYRDADLDLNPRRDQ